jgi:hypothetical protein
VAKKIAYSVTDIMDIDFLVKGKWKLNSMHCVEIPYLGTPHIP